VSAQFWTSVSLAFGAGMIAVVNPCGFAMLPAYLSYFLGLDDPSRDQRSAVLRAVATGLVVSAGFVVVFGIIGLAIELFSLSIGEQLPYVTMVIGVALAGLGVAMLFGFEPTVALPKLDKGTGSRQLGSMFVFGISYAIASLSCTIPVFLVAVTGVFTTGSTAEGLAVFLAYAAGMAIVLISLTVTLALARRSLVNRLRSALPKIHRISGVLLVVAGAFLAYYGWYERQVLDGNVPDGGLASSALSLQGDVSSWIDRVGPVTIGLWLLGGLVVVGVIATAVSARRRPSEGSDAAS
jgi:cytochrome c biogenesis protein CcdA